MQINRVPRTIPPFQKVTCDHIKRRRLVQRVAVGQRIRYTIEQVGHLDLQSCRLRAFGDPLQRLAGQRPCLGGRSAHEGVIAGEPDLLVRPRLGPVAFVEARIVPRGLQIVPERRFIEHPPLVQGDRMARGFHH